MQIGAVILAAGLGSRFDPTGRSDKLLAPWHDGQPVLWHSATKVLEAVDTVVAVIRPEQAQRREWLERLGIAVVASARARAGMGAALGTGIDTLAAVDACLVCLGDMPAIRIDTIEAVRNGLTHQRAMAAPRFEDQAGHPVGFGAHWFDELRALSGDRGPRHLLTREEVNWIEVDDPGCRIDVDCPADLAAAVTEFSPRPV